MRIKFAFFSAVLVVIIIIFTRCASNPQLLKTQKNTSEILQTYKNNVFSDGVYI